MNSQVRFAKTDKGQEEIRNRTYRLQPRPRALLVIVDGKKAADELVQTAERLGGGPGLLESLLKEGFIEEVREAPATATPEAAPAAAVSPSEESRVKVYAAKAAMRRYIKLVAVDLRALNKLVDEVRTLEDVPRAMGELKVRFDSNGYGEAFANLRQELSGLL